MDLEALAEVIYHSGLYASFTPSRRLPYASDWVLTRFSDDVLSRVEESTISSMVVHSALIILSYKSIAWVYSSIQDLMVWPTDPALMRYTWNMKNLQ